MQQSHELNVCVRAYVCVCVSLQLLNMGVCVFVCVCVCICWCAWMAIGRFALSRKYGFEVHLGLKVRCR